ncbi:membrane protein [Streptomyces spiroverticillatus]|uniref:Membrane protein n=1 Tax=Streptomyces finlayi TaxID=67296 RepID=A0A918WYK4_9ACTN|nr:SPFH domain-containing protein [Streptomyces finlayi]GHA10620.1 membrane protein [Streptomyces spiroverticillatus]GHC95515.1 membrane protein [Streptomyces finlayi]
MSETTGTSTGTGTGTVGGAARHPVIRNEATTEIPVHLLFRDETGETPAVAAGTTVVGRRQGTGEQRRVTGQGPKAVADRAPVERPGPAGPGWAAVGVGLAAAAGCAAVLWWAGLAPGPVRVMLGLPLRTYDGMGVGEWGALAGLVGVGLCAFGGLTRGREGQASVLTLFGAYRGSVRRTGLVWLSPLLVRRRVDVTLKHWRSEPLAVADRSGIPLRVVVLVVWRVADTARATLGVSDHAGHLRGQVEAGLARVVSQLPADALGAKGGGGGRTVRDAAAVGDALTRQVAARAAAAGIEVFSVQPLRVEYAPEVAEAMRRRRFAALDAADRERALGTAVDAVEDTVRRLTARGLVGELDDYERRSLVRELTVAYLGGR